MYKDNITERQCPELISKMNHEPPPDDEYGRTSVCDVLTEASMTQMVFVTNGIYRNFGVKP